MTRNKPVARKMRCHLSVSFPFYSKFGIRASLSLSMSCGHGGGQYLVTSRLHFHNSQQEEGWNLNGKAKNPEKQSILEFSWKNIALLQKRLAQKGAYFTFTKSPVSSGLQTRSIPNEKFTSCSSLELSTWIELLFPARFVFERSTQRGTKSPLL